MPRFQKGRRNLSELAVPDIALSAVAAELKLDFAPTRFDAPEPEARATAIRVRDLVVGFGDKIIMDGLDLDVMKGEVLGFVGGSGMGKSVLTRTILGLVPKRAGSISVFGEDLDTLSHTQRVHLQRRFGVMFQQGALLSGLTVKQNVQIPMREHLRLSPALAEEACMASALHGLLGLHHDEHLGLQRVLHRLPFGQPLPDIEAPRLDPLLKERVILLDLERGLEPGLELLAKHNES